MTVAPSTSSAPAKTPPPVATPERLDIETRDGTALAACLFRPEPGNELGRLVQVHSATAVRQGIYAKMAAFLASQGMTVVTFDYRGTGDSLRGSIRESTATMREWGELDIPSVIDWVGRRFPDHRHLCVAHSVGGQILGLADNCDRLQGVWAVASQWGTWTLWPWPRRWLNKGLFELVAPPATALAGYFPGKLMGMGNLPKGIGLEWARWCSSKHYVCDEDGNPLRPHYDRLQCPVVWNALADDPVFGPPRAVAAMPGLYPAAQSTVQVLEPKDAGAPIGHFGYFRSRFRDTLWGDAARWLATV